MCGNCGVEFGFLSDVVGYDVVEECDFGFIIFYVFDGCI